jgi:hypothetical protein
MCFSRLSISTLKVEGTLQAQLPPPLTLGYLRTSIEIYHHRLKV